MADEDKSNKTEDPTQKRRDEAHKKGNVAFSREINSFMVLAVLAIVVAWMLPDLLKRTLALLRPVVERSYDHHMDTAGFGEIMRQVMFGSVAIMIIPLLGVMVGVVISSFLQNGILFTSEPIMPKLERISPLSGIKRLFSLRSVMEFLKGIFKMVIVGTVAFLAVYPDISHIHQLPNSNMEDTLFYMAKLATRMTIGVAIAMFFIAILDFMYQRFAHTKSLRMSHQEIKDEYKQSEGDPIIKQKLRQLRQERARNRMMQAVPEADVVITNPTHFAVALKYDSETMKAPLLVAKGQDYIAQKIREIAEESDIPIVENPPLARALFASCEIDEEVPILHYEAVAKVISYVYGLKKKKA